MRISDWSSDVCSSDLGRYTIPRKAGGRYFYGYNKGLQNQTPLYVREGLTGRQRLLIDPNDWAEDGSDALAEWAPSPDGRFLLYAVQEAGSDWRTLKILDVATARPLEDENGRASCREKVCQLV